MDTKVSITSEHELSAFAAQAGVFYAALEKLASDLEDRLARTRALQRQLRQDVDLVDVLNEMKSTPSRSRPTIPIKGTNPLDSFNGIDDLTIARRLAPEPTDHQAQVFKR
jgi:hypothetical protein